MSAPAQAQAAAQARATGMSAPVQAFAQPRRIPALALAHGPAATALAVTSRAPVSNLLHSSSHNPNISRPYTQNAPNYISDV